VLIVRPQTDAAGRRVRRGRYPTGTLFRPSTLSSLRLDRPVLVDLAPGRPYIDMADDSAPLRRQERREFVPGWPLEWGSNYAVVYLARRCVVAVHRSMIVLEAEREGHRPPERDVEADPQLDLPKPRKVGERRQETRCGA